MGIFNHFLEREKIRHFGRSQIITQQLILDRVPGAVFAYSTRLLSSNYFGPCLKVRRSSDNTTQDIYFVGGSIDVTSLQTFCSGTNGFVDTWYDQSGRSVNMVQSTVGSQPQIVVSGTINSMIGGYYLDFDGSNDFFENASGPVVSSSFFVSYALTKLDTTASQLIIAGNNLYMGLQQLSGTSYFYTSPTTYGSYTFSDTANANRYASVFNGAETGNSARLKGYVNNLSVSMSYTGTIGATVSGTGMAIGRPYATNLAYLDGRMIETIGWDRNVGLVTP